MKKRFCLGIASVLFLTLTFSCSKDLIPKSGNTTRKEATRDDNMGMGNPSNANSTDPGNYLMEKAQYTLSYNNSKGTANWVSWHLSTAWLGTATRCNCFEGGAALPADYFQAVHADYTGTGFDRGHLCPSADRTGSAEDNRATFLMTNIIPQAPANNQQTWATLESYCRNLVGDGNELYIIAGGYGAGGSGRNGDAASIAGGDITVPSSVWKIIVVLPVGGEDVSRITASTRVIAVDMPNIQSVGGQSWTSYLTNVNAIEEETGYDFLSNVSEAVQRVIEARIDDVSL